MNYWLANLTGLHELNYPLFAYLDRLLESGKITAQKFWNARRVSALPQICGYLRGSELLRPIGAFRLERGDDATLLVSLFIYSRQKIS